jgi:hypothetical protein
LVGGHGAHATGSNAHDDGRIAEGDDGTPLAGSNHIQAMQQVDHGFHGWGGAAEGDVDPIGRVSRAIAARVRGIHIGSPVDVLRG